MIRLNKIIKRREKKNGLPPGTPIYTGEKKEEKVRISIIDYTEDQFQEMEVKTIEECFSFKESPSVTWINIDGIHQVGIIEKIGKHFELHPLVLEEIVNPQQRPKMENFGQFVYIVFKMLQ
jgi:magnesium transporter